MSSPGPWLALEHVDAAYGRRAVLSDVSLTLERGEFVALLGPNGAGKSTVLKAVFGLARVTAGAVRLAGEDITGARPAEQLARGLAFLPQGGQVFGPLTVAENLALAQALHPVAATRAPWLPPPLPEQQGQRAESLSGGQKQQLAFAMALLGQPQLLLVDEPSIGLAPALAQAALASLASAREQHGLTVLLVEQNVGLALEFADRAVLLVSGRVVAQAPTAAIRADAGLRRQFTLGLETATGQ